MTNRRKDNPKIMARIDREEYAEFQLRRNILSLTIDDFTNHIITKYLEDYPRDDFEFPKGW